MLDMKHYIISLIAVCMFTLGLSAQRVAEYNMVYLDMASGLPNNYVDDIFQDSYGFVWLSTHGEGLVRYDGFTFQNFGVSSVTIPLRSNSCRNVTEDKFKRLWIAFDEGVQVLSLQTMSPVMPDTENEKIASLFKSLRQERCMRSYCDTKGAVWLIMVNHIYRLAFTEDGKISGISSISYTSYAPDLGIADIFRRGTVVMGFGGKVMEIVPQANRLITKDMSRQFPSLNGRYVGDIISYHGKIWLATNAGLFNNGKTNNEYHHSATDNSLQHDLVASLAVSPQGKLLVGTLAGVDIIDGRTGEIEHWNSSSPVNPLSCDFVNHLFCVNGQIWVATETGGITKLVPRKLDFVNYQNVSIFSSSAGKRAVNAMYAEPDGTLWVGVVEGGLNCLPPQSNSFIHYTTSNSNLLHNSVSVLAPDEYGNLWIGTWGGGVCVMNLKDGRIRQLEVDSKHASLLTFVGAMVYDPINDGMWIGANEGLYFYNFSTRNLEEPFKGWREIRGNIGCLITSNNHLLMGGQQGMVDVDLKSRPVMGMSRRGYFKMRQYRYKLDAPQSKIIDKILCFCQTRDGKIWMGSNGYGMYECTFDENDSLTVKNFTMENGLANNVVKGIVEDGRGMLWIATEYGLSIFNPKTQQFNNFYQRDGLLSSQFYFNGAIISQSGIIYLGTDMGLIAAKGEKQPADYKSNLRFTALGVDNQAIFAGSKYLNEDISIAKYIYLHESDKSFTIHFSALNYGSETQGIYSYRMKGLEDEWIQLQPGQHSVRYSTLPAGDYEFMVKYSPSIGSDKEQVISIKVSVTPYFWKSWWFITIIVIGIIALLQYAYLRRLKQIREREVEALYRPIEAALKESNEPGKLQSRIQTILKNQQLYQESLVKTIEMDKEEVKKKAAPFMERIMDIMERNYGNSEFGVQELADAMGMNRSLLSKKLGAETGLPTTQFIRDYRLNVARRLILENVGNRNITEIAYRVGFNDSKYFTRCFTKQYGVSPTNYKE